MCNKRNKETEEEADKIEKTCELNKERNELKKKKDDEEKKVKDKE